MLLAAADGPTTESFLVDPPAPVPRTAQPRASLVGLGDSIPAASNCSECTPFVDLLGDRLSVDRDTPVQVINLGVDGWTSTDLLDSLAPDREEATATSTADIVTVTIGANDFYPQFDTYLGGDCGGDDGLACFTAVLPELEDTLTSVLERIFALDAARPTVLVTGYWNVFPDGAVARQLYGPQFVDDSAELTRRTNDVIAAVARDHGAIYVDLLTVFKGDRGDRDPTDLLSDDGDHPNQDGHRRIAGALQAALGPGPRYHSDCL